MSSFHQWSSLAVQVNMRFRFAGEFPCLSLAVGKLDMPVKAAEVVKIVNLRAEF
jgi:hypothetical protein